MPIPPGADEAIERPRRRVRPNFRRRKRVGVLPSRRRLLTALSIAALLVCSVAAGARARPVTNSGALLLAVGAPYAPLVAIAALVLAVVARRLLLSIVAAVVIATVVSVQVSWYHFGEITDVGAHVDVRILSSNLRMGRSDPFSFVKIAKESADLIAVIELTSEERRRLADAGIDEAFRYSVLSPAPGAGGIGLWSRFPILEVPDTSATDSAMVAARLQIPHLRYNPMFCSVHVISPIAPVTAPLAKWQRGIGEVDGVATKLADAGGPGAVIIAGDFNSTPDMLQFRQLLNNGYRDGVEQRGAGYGPTFPSDLPLGIPPLITIDHILTRNSVVSSIHDVHIAGSDHRALLASVKVPLDPTAIG